MELVPDFRICTDMGQDYAKFTIGQRVHHQRFDYRGVIVDVDAVFQGSDEWYRQIAKSYPPKDKPWYRVLVHDQEYETYVAEHHLENDYSSDPINHPLVGAYFSDFRGGVYVLMYRSN